jgi:hypothetical protein
MGRDPVVVQSSELIRLGKMPKLSEIKNGQVSTLPPATQFVNDLAGSAAKIEQQLQAARL